MVVARDRAAPTGNHVGLNHSSSTVEIDQSAATDNWRAEGVKVVAENDDVEAVVPATEACAADDGRAPATQHMRHLLCDTGAETKEPGNGQRLSPGCGKRCSAGRMANPRLATVAPG